MCNLKICLLELEVFQNRVKEFEQILENLNDLDIKWIEPQWFHIEPQNEEYSSISIRYEFDEIRVGIDHVKEYYSDKYGNGRTYNDGIFRFKELLYSRIKRQAKYKGNCHFRTDYFVERNGKFEKFATMLFWLFPYWRRTRIDEYIQNPIILNK